MTDFPSFANFPSPPRIEVPEIRFVDLTADQIKALPDGELLRVLSGEYDDGAIVPASLQQLISAELLARALTAASKPHWSVVPAFWLILATAILALVAAAAAVLALPQVQYLLRP